MTPEIFIRDDDPEDLDLGNITTVSVCRQVNGSWESVPMKYDISQIDEVEKLHELLGPGFFELIGRDDRTRRIVRRQKVRIAGVPWKTWNSGHQEETAQSQPQARLQPEESAGAFSSDKLWMFMLQNMQATQQQNQQFMMTLMTTMQANSDKNAQSLAQMMGQMNQSQTAMFTAMLNKAGGADPTEVFLKAVETMNELRAGVREGAAETEGEGAAGVKEVIEAVSAGVETFAKVRNITSGTPPAT